MALQQPSSRPERRLTVLLIATGAALAVIGTVVGALMLVDLSGIRVDFGLSLFPAHPYLQIFGFLAEFVMGVGYSLLPRFKGRPMPALQLGYVCYILVTSSNVLILLAVLLQVPPVLGSVLPAFLLMAASLIFAAQVINLATHSKGGFPEANPLMMISSISFILAAFLLLLEAVGILPFLGVFSVQLVYLGLLGFVGSMIYAVELRSVFIRLCNYRRRAAEISYISQGFATALAFLSAILNSMLLMAFGSLLYLVAALSLLRSTKIVERAHPLTSGHEIPPLHRHIIRYNEISMLLGSGWLIVGCILGLAWLSSGEDSFFLRDSFIHSISIGFIASTIVSFAPLLLPGILSRRGPSQSLTLGPALILNLGVLLRVVGDLLSLDSARLPVWESISGPLILVAMAWFLGMLHGLLIRQKRPRLHDA